MIRILIVAIITVMTAGCVSSSRIDAGDKESKREKFISFNGMGRVFYQPTLLDLGFTIYTDGPDIDATLGIHQGKSKAVDACIAKYGDHVQLRFIKPNKLSRKEHVHEERGTRVTEIWYTFITEYYLRMDIIDNVDEIQADIVRSGVNDIAYMDFFSDQLERFKEEARNNAIDDATDKMASLAKKMHWNNVRVRDIGVQNEEYVSYNRDNQASAVFGMRSGGGKRVNTSASKGLQYIDAKVSINFLYDE